MKKAKPLSFIKAKETACGYGGTVIKSAATKSIDTTATQRVSIKRDRARKCGERMREKEGEG